MCSSVAACTLVLLLNTFCSLQGCGCQTRAWEMLVRLLWGTMAAAGALMRRASLPMASLAPCTFGAAQVLHSLCFTSLHTLGKRLCLQSCTMPVCSS